MRNRIWSQPNHCHPASNHPDQGHFAPKRLPPKCETAFGVNQTHFLLEKRRKGIMRKTEIIKELSGRAALLKKEIKKAEKASASFPEGRLRVSHNGKKERFYKVDENKDESKDENKEENNNKKDKFGVYIPASEKKLVADLAQKDYNREFLRLATKELKGIEKSIRALSAPDADDAYKKASQTRKELIMPYIITDEMFVKEWLDNKPGESGLMPEGRIYDTRRGEKVRSKSESIIADILYDLGIPYHYEKPLCLKNGRIRYPDFTLLDIP
ncbi:MAG: hypothetical protein IJU59_00515, partial [Firmicutes bacterium]|nr:hypothetical protein [Bacillota bacterium]